MRALCCIAASVAKLAYWPLNKCPACCWFSEKFVAPPCALTEFGCPGYFRLCFAKSDQELIKACDSISEAIELLT